MRRDVGRGQKSSVCKTVRKITLRYVPKLLWIDGHSVVDAKKGVPSLSGSILAVILVEYAITPHQLKEGSQCNMLI